MAHTLCNKQASSLLTRGSKRAQMAAVKPAFASGAVLSKPVLASVSPVARKVVSAAPRVSIQAQSAASTEAAAAQKVRCCHCSRM